MKKTAVVILNWNGEKLLTEFLPSVLEHTSSALADVVVVDNGSTDHSLSLLKSEFPTVKILNLGSNYGFAEGYNRALTQLDNEYVVLLNNDVRVTQNWLEPLIEYLDANTKTAACQPKIRSQRQPEYFEHAGACGGFIDVLGYPFCRGRLMQHVEKDTLQYEEITSIFWATGACLCIRLADYQLVGGLDDSFFAHMEEIDLCWRLKSRGKNLVCIPQSTVYHLGAATLSNENPQKTYLNFRNNLLMLYKNLPQNRLIITLIIRLLLDFAAMIMMLVKGQPTNAFAVMRAVNYFYHHKKNYRQKRVENLSKTIQSSFPEMYKGSIVFDFYFLRKRIINR